MTNQISDAGIAFIQRFEGCRLTSYQDGAGKWTIATGHCGPNIGPGLSISQDQADAYLRLDLLTVERTINQLVTKSISQGAYDALCDFVFNVGSGNFAKSTLLKLINAGQMADAAAEFGKWTKDAKGNVEPGLVTRREDEKALFLS